VLAHNESGVIGFVDDQEWVSPSQRQIANGWRQCGLVENPILIDRLDMLRATFLLVAEIQRDPG
jgi:hypothetical protein